MKCGMDTPPSTPTSSNGQHAPWLPLYERIHATDARLREVRRDLHHAARRIRTLEATVREIERRISAAILWLALGAGALLLKLIGPKLGL